VLFYDENYKYMVVFESKKLTEIIAGISDTELVEILLGNAELFCVPGGQSFITDKNGVTRLVNVYDAVGLSTGYLKNDSDWRSRTIMLSTSRKDLQDKLKNASKSE
jgi:hypothetical protein